MKLDSHDNVLRQFIALFIGSTVRKDGQVPGFDAWWRTASDFAREQVYNCAEWCWTKVERDGRDPDECIASGVSYAREQIRLYRPPAEPTAPTREEVAEIVSVATAHFDAMEKRDQPTTPARPALPPEPRAGDESYFDALRRRGLPPALAKSDSAPENLPA